MKAHILFMGLILLLFPPLLLSQTGNPPTPVPPPDDDLPIFIRLNDVDIVSESMVRLRNHPGATSLFDQGGRLLSAATRSFNKHQTHTWTTDFMFFLGQAQPEGYGRFVVVKVRCIHAIDSGALKWHISQSQELVLKKAVPMPLAHCLAAHPAALEACASVLQDATIKDLTRNLLPYYHCQAIHTPVTGAPYPQYPITVTLTYVHAQNPDDKVIIQVDYSESVGAYNIKKGSTQPGNGGGHDQ